MIGSRKDEPMQPVKFEVRRDDDVGVWYAVSTGELGIVTEAATLDGLRERLTWLVPDFLELDGPCPIEMEICGSEQGGPA